MQNAIGMVEVNSIAKGIYIADQMLKRSEVEVVTCSTVCPGKYISVVHGLVAAVKESVEKGVEDAGTFLVDSIVIPNVHPGAYPGDRHTGILLALGDGDRGGRRAQGRGA